MSNAFTEFGLRADVVQAVEELGYESPTPIQTAVIPLMLDGQDVIGQAQTGTGKTAAFALPILHRLNFDQKQASCLVLSPTRELAQQVAKAIYDYGRHRGVRVLAIYGGQSYDRQIRRIKKGVDIVVGTPGRLLDLIRRKVLDLSKIQTLVLDEADEMLSMGFIEDIETILKETPEQRQTALFSATIPAEVRKLAQQYMHSPKTVAIKEQQLTVAAIEQRYYLVNPEDKMAALTRMFELEDLAQVLIFVRTRIETGNLANALTVRGFPAEALSGDLSQEAREGVLKRFRGGQLQVLVATDVAARGLDIEGISHVFNYELSPDPEIYVHRIGRTGRAGRTGIAVSLVVPQDIQRLRRIEKYSGNKIPQASIPSEEEIFVHRNNVLMEKMAIWLRRGRCKQEREMVESLAIDGYDPMEIAAVALKMARAEEKQRPIETISEVRKSAPGRRSGRNGKSNRSNRSPRPGRQSRNPRDRSGRSSHEAGMVRLALSKGKSHGLRPNDVVGAIAFHAGIPGHTIGKIQINETSTLVDVPKEFVNQVLENAGAYRIRNTPVGVEIA